MYSSNSLIFLLFLSLSLHPSTDILSYSSSTLRCRVFLHRRACEFPAQKKGQKRLFKQMSDRFHPSVFPGEIHPIFIGYTFMWEKDRMEQVFEKVLRDSPKKRGIHPLGNLWEAIPPFPRKPRKGEKCTPRFQAITRQTGNPLLLSPRSASHIPERKI